MHIFVVIVFNGIGVEDIRTLPYGGLTVFETPTQGTGYSAAATLPTSSSIAIKRASGSTGRSARGRIYWPLYVDVGFTNADVLGGSRASATVAAVQAWQTAVEAALTPALLGHVSTVTGGAPRSTGIFFHTTSWQLVDDTVDTQRRRLLGRGR